MAYNKPIPPQGQHTQPFWAGAKEGKLMLPRCRDCNRVHWYPRHICPFCHSTDLEWIEASGKGRLHTYAVQHRAFGGWGEEVPYVTAFIDLDEGDRMMTVLRGVDAAKPEEIKIGSRVAVEFEQANDDTFIPFWRVMEETQPVEQEARLVTGDDALPFIDGNPRGATYALAEGGYKITPKPGSIIAAIYEQLASGSKTGEALTQATKNTPRGGGAQSKVFGESDAAGTLRWLVKQSRLHVVVAVREE